VNAAERQREGACPACVRRSWLLGALNGRLEYRGRDPERLVSLLELSDEQLIHAIGGDEQEGLLERCVPPETSTPDATETVPPGATATSTSSATRTAPLGATATSTSGATEISTSGTRIGVEQICRHDPRYPNALKQSASAPRMLHVAGGIARLTQLLDQPAVAVVGTRRASDYGMEVAHGLARGLAASGITVVSGLAEGIPAAAHAGALEAAGPTLTVMPGGVDVCHPAAWRALYRQIVSAGCAVAELPCGCAPRSWCHTARARIIAALTQMVIVVEAGERPAELLPARLAAASGAIVAAVPGRVSAPAASGPHRLLREGAQLVCDPQDALDALYGVDTPHAPAARSTLAPKLAPHLRAVLNQVCAGRDTVAKLTAGDESAGASMQETLVALAKLEISGALVRGDGGRYVVCR
jgi:DNA processing protein